jgi:excisionase family DNA binding protein
MLLTIGAYCYTLYIWHRVAREESNMKGATLSNLLTAEQVAKKLGKPTSWVYNNLRREGIPFIKLGQQYRFAEEELDTWILGKIEGASG